MDCAAAPKKVRKSKTCRDLARLASLVRRPEDFFETTAASPPYAEMLPIGNNGQYVMVKTFNETVYVCIRNYYYKEDLQRWLPSRTGLNLTCDEWKTFMSYRTGMLVQDAIYQETNRTEPTVKGNQMHEEQEPTSWPETMLDGTTLHRICISVAANKFVVVSRRYSRFGDVMVSFLQYPDATADVHDKGIHLSLHTYKCLAGERMHIDVRVDAEMLKNETAFAEKYFYQSE